MGVSQDRYVTGYVQVSVRAIVFTQILDDIMISSGTDLLVFFSSGT
jgi:hypothetical protein